MRTGELTRRASTLWEEERREKESENLEREILNYRENPTEENRRTLLETQRRYLRESLKREIRELTGGRS